MQVAQTHEYGSKKRNIPERSFLRLPLKKYQTANARTQAQIFNEVVLNGRDPLTELNVFGQILVKQSQKCIRTKGFSTWPELSKEYLKRKKENKNRILYYTGLLYRNITYEVRRKN